MYVSILRTLLFFSLFALLVVPGVTAQVHGVPASVSSFGFGGNFSSAPGVPASVTSLGPMGFRNAPIMSGNCCFSNFHFRDHAFNRNSSGFSGRHHFRRGFFSSGYGYAVPYTPVYVVPEEDMYGERDAYADDEEEAVRAALDRRTVLRKQVHEALMEEKAGTAAALPAAPAALREPEPAREQPSTLLVFKDGHQSEIQNYAILGDTLFNFSDARSYRILIADLDLSATRKANLDRGVDFQLPPDTKQ